jgi:hypothetical protein
MKKLVAVAAVAALFPAIAVAQQNNIGSCGWGSKVFDGQSGLAPQVLGATTNGTFGNQTFGITSGTSGCTQDGAVRSTWKTAMFIDGNKETLARDSLAHLLGVEAADRAAFNRIARDNMQRIFPRDNAETEQVVAALREVLMSDAKLARYTVAL